MFNKREESANETQCLLEYLLPWKQIENSLASSYLFHLNETG